MFKLIHRLTNQGPVEIKTDGRTVWINAPTGSMIGRLSPMGIDVHHTGSWSGTHCADCRPVPEEGAWDAFVQSVKKHHGLEVPKSFRPGWCK